MKDELLLILLDNSCYDCLTAMGEDTHGNYTNQMDTNCEREDYSIAPLPSTVIAQQEARNKTASVPTISEPTETATSEAISIDLSYTTRFHETYTTTIYGTPTVSLPDIAAATETSGSVSSYTHKASLMVAACGIVLVALILI